MPSRPGLTGQPRVAIIDAIPDIRSGVSKRATVMNIELTHLVLAGIGILVVIGIAVYRIIEQRFSQLDNKVDSVLTELVAITKDFAGRIGRLEGKEEMRAERRREDGTTDRASSQ